MKKIMTFFALVLLVVSACKKDDDDNGSGTPDSIPDDPPKVRYFEYKVDGVAYRRDSILNDTLYDLDLANNVFLKLRDGDTELLYYVTPLEGEQEYFDVYIQRRVGNNLVCVDGTGGFINIYKIDTLNNYMEASFSGDCDDLSGKDITDGVFLIDYFE